MAEKENSFVESQEGRHDFTMALASALLEWLLIFMLFLDAFFSYLITRFARYCKLQVPCLLCSRLDHVLGNAKHRFYWDLICGNHKLEISSLVFCQIHNKLVDVRGMCESCLFSFATINKSNTETYRLLVGKLGTNPPLELDEDPSFEDHEHCSLITRKCSCCNETWTSRSHAANLLRTKSVGLDPSELNILLSVATEHNDYDLKKIGEESSRSSRALKMGKDSFDPLSHVEYTKVKITSDTESEDLILDNDVNDAVIYENTNIKDEISVQCVQVEPQIITLAHDLTSEKLIHLDSVSETPVLDSQGLLDVVDSHGSASVASNTAVGLGLEELNWSQVDWNRDDSAGNLTSSDEVRQSSNITGTPFEEVTVSLEQKSGDEDVEISEVRNCPVKSNEMSFEMNPVAGEVVQKSGNEYGEISKVRISPVIPVETSETNTVTGDTCLPLPNDLDLGDAYKLAVGNKARQLSGKFLEQMCQESTRVSEDLKLLLSQMSATRGIELASTDMSPRVSGIGDELKSDSSSSIGLHILQKRMSLERNESGLSLDGSIVSEVEGESETDRLKRQVEHDKKLMSALYKELEEERNASAVAANQAMAMITKLQEEKAALHMEALQCLRMMEEQAEYDVEALQKSNELLTDKEKEIQDLEAEIEFYTNKFGDMSILENEVGSASEIKAGETGSRPLYAVYSDNDANGQQSYDKDTLLEFEDQRLYILQNLRKLEKKLILFCDDGIYMHSVNDKCSGNEKDNNSQWEEFERGDASQEVSGEEKSYSLMEKHVSVSEKSHSAQEGPAPSFDNPQCVSKGRSEYNSIHTDVVSLVDDISSLIGRLETGVGSHNSLEHSVSSFSRGDGPKVYSKDSLSLVGTMEG